VNYCEYKPAWCEWAKKTYNPPPFVGDGYGSLTGAVKAKWTDLKCFQAAKRIYEGTGAKCLSWINDHNVVQGAVGVITTNWEAFHQLTKPGISIPFSTAPTFLTLPLVPSSDNARTGHYNTV
jgi:hypothetical protein